MSTSERIILLDVDGILADFAGRFRGIANKISGLNLSREEVAKSEWRSEKSYPEEFRKEILARTRDEGFCLEMEVLPGAVEGVEALRKMGHVYAVTAPWKSKTWCSERTSWLAHKLKFHENDVIHAHDKWLIDGDVLIDDKPENILEWARRHWPRPALLWDALYNQAVDNEMWVRVYGWSEVLDKLTKYWG